MPRARGRQQRQLLDDPDLGYFLSMLQLAQGRPIKPYQLAKEVLYREPPLSCGETNRIRKLGTKFKGLLDLVDELYPEDDRPKTAEDTRQTAIKVIRYLMTAKVVHEEFRRNPELFI